MTVEHDDLRCCVDCLFFLANGDDCSGVAERIANRWDHDAGRLVVACSPDCTDCTDFSWSPCEVCGSQLGGERHKAALLANDPA